MCILVSCSRSSKVGAITAVVCVMTLDMNGAHAEYVIVGQSGGPMVLSVLTSIATLGTASVATGVIGLAGAAIMWLFVEEPLPKRPRPT